MPDRSRAGWRPWAQAAVCVLLAWLAVGAFASLRGLWQDEVQVLFRQFSSTGEWWWQRVFITAGTPARRLVGVPFRLGLVSGRPMTTLFAILAAAWLLTGVAAAALARRLWRGLPAAPFLACALTVAATPDFFTASLVTLHYVLSIAATLLATIALLDYAERGGAWRLGVIVLSLGGSFFFVDAPLTAYALAPLLLVGRGASRRRVVVGIAAWYAAGVPYLLLIVPALLDPASYLSHATRSLPLRARAARLLDLVVHNVTPWRWGYARPLWFPREATVVAAGARAAWAVLAGVAVAVLVATRGESGEGTAVRGRRAAFTIAALVLLAVAANAAYASVVLAEFHCRTHLFSRVWTGVLLAGGLASLAARGTAWRACVAAAAGAWVALGTWGGLERQDYFAGHWRRHRAELVSLLQAAPGLAPDAKVLLRVPAHDGFVSVEAGYIARGWMTLLHEDPALECRVVLWADGRPNVCQPSPEGLVCRGERSPDCVRREGVAEDRVALERLVWLDYDPSARRFGLRRTLPEPFDPSARYAPDALIVQRQPTPLARALLDRPGGSFRPGGR